MPSVTSTTFEPKESKVMALMGLNRGNEDFSAIVDGAFIIDENRQQKIRNRAKIKDFNITDWNFEEDIAKKEEIKKLPPEWLLAKVAEPKTNEYITIKRKNYISNIIKHIQEINNTLKDEHSLKMSLAIFKNEIYTIYKTFLENGQDEHFLSILNLVEDVVCKKEINSKILRECILILKELIKKEIVQYLDYEIVVKRFMEKNIDIVSIEES